MTDAELIRQVQRGDVVAWRSLYARCLPSVWRQVRALVADHAAAEDVVGETLLALVRNIPSLDAETVRFHAWLRGVVRHKAADYGRGQSQQNRSLAAARERSPQIDDAAAVSSSLEVEETRRQVHVTLERMSDLQRLVLEWKHADELSVEEIATRLGRTQKSVESILYRARIEFRRVHQLVRSSDAADGPRPGSPFRYEAQPVEESL